MSKLYNSSCVLSKNRGKGGKNIQCSPSLHSHKLLGQLHHTQQLPFPLLAAEALVAPPRESIAAHSVVNRVSKTRPRRNQGKLHWSVRLVLFLSKIFFLWYFRNSGEQIAAGKIPDKCNSVCTGRRPHISWTKTPHSMSHIFFHSKVNLLCSPTQCLSELKI